ncbi:MAG: hypothetical protein H0X46_04585 [Bacteroidetes bacterium]|nr:hypothetical protein [Bacteroidota bacterium]
MIKAGSLFYAIVISLIIAIVSSSLILFAYLTHIQFESFEINQRLQLNSDSGINLLLSRQSLVGINEAKTIDLFREGTDSVNLTRKSWGAYEVVISEAIFKNSSFIRMAQVGYYSDTSERYSLYLADEDRALGLCGRTVIKGLAYLPKQGAKRTYIEGENFVGRQLVQGNIKQSKRTIPVIRQEFIDNIQSVCRGQQITDSVVFIDNELSEDSLSNSFLLPTLVLNAGGPLRISSGFYSGNIVILSKQIIRIAPNATLENIIISAPKVIVEKGFIGNLQIFASDSVILEEDVTLSYPSVIGLLRDERSPVCAAIVLNKNDTVAGNIFAYKKETDVLKQAAITIDYKSMVYGQIYSSGHVDVKGTLYGSLMCTKILLKTSSSSYDNQLLNAVIDVSKLSTYFVGIDLVETSVVRRVVKWLN